MRPTCKMHLCHRAEFLTYFLFPYEYIFAEFCRRKVKNVIEEKMLTSMDNKKNRTRQNWPIFAYIFATKVKYDSQGHQSALP